MTAQVRLPAVMWGISKMSEPVVYLGKRINGEPRVFRGVLQGNTLQRVRIITPYRSLKIVRHSPTGFEWGYGGSGPAQLALAILFDYTHNTKLADVLHQRFKFTFLSNAKSEGWQINSSEIDEFLKEHQDLVAVL